jgi:hypothetical protein
MHDENDILEECPYTACKGKQLQDENEKLIYLITVMRDYEKDGIPFDEMLKNDIKQALKDE